MSQPTIEQFMTRAPHTIAHHKTLSTAHAMMKELSIRHLPVLQAGKLVGILSERDLHFIESLKTVEPEKARVTEAMSSEVFTVGPKASVQRVAQRMADHKYGCAVVMNGAKVAGVFTTIDALRALSGLLGTRARRGR